MLHLHGQITSEVTLHRCSRFGIGVEIPLQGTNLPTYCTDRILYNRFDFGLEPYERKKWAGDEESECHAKLTWTVVWQRRQVSYLDQRLSALAHGLRNAREIAFLP